MAINGGQLDEGVLWFVTAGIGRLFRVASVYAACAHADLVVAPKPQYT